MEIQSLILSSILLLHNPVVIDGDTISGTIQGIPPVFGENISIRILGIDAPEIHSHCLQEGILAKKAKDRVISLINSSPLELHDVKRDKYFRLDARVISNGVDIGKTLLQEGLAKEYFGEIKESWCGGKNVSY